MALKIYTSINKTSRLRFIFIYFLFYSAHLCVAPSSPGFAGSPSDSTPREQTFVKVALGEWSLHAPKEYKPEKWLGSGSFGQVAAVSCSDGASLAVKQIAIRPNAGLAFLKSPLRELLFLRRFNHKNLISRKRAWTTSSATGGLETVCVSMELMEYDLRKVILSATKFEIDHVKYISYQILNALNYMHSAGVIHADLKPANIFINEDCQIKVGDLGTARLSKLMPKLLKEEPYIVTRWYRAPELVFKHLAIIDQLKISETIDMWSLGCIIGELLARKPLFAGETTSEQEKILELFFSDPTSYLKQAVPRIDDDTLHLLTELLMAHPELRLQAKEALNHPFFVKFRCPESETTYEGPSLDDDFKFECDVDLQKATCINHLKLESQK